MPNAATPKLSMLLNSILFKDVGAIEVIIVSVINSIFSLAVPRVVSVTRIHFFAILLTCLSYLITRKSLLKHGASRV